MIAISPPARKKRVWGTGEAEEIAGAGLDLSSLVL